MTPVPEPAQVDRGAEAARLAGPDVEAWRRWGPYQSARQWGTVREDYSADGDAWSAFPFEHSGSRAYRWGEDGIGGLCDDHGFLHLSLALWNGQDDRLKERFFGLTNGQGNHGEDVKEYWWALDATPTHSWGSMLYRYPQAAYPYSALVEVSARRGRDEPEYELTDTGVLDDNRFFDVVVRHAKAAHDDVCLVVEATNMGPDPAPLHLVPQVSFRNTWAWGRDARRPSIRRAALPGDHVALECTHAFLGTYALLAEGAPEVLACENETDVVGLYGAAEALTPYPKNGVERAVVHGDRSATNPSGAGTKVGLHHAWAAVAPGATVTVRLRLRSSRHGGEPFGAGFDEVVADRSAEADAFYAGVIPPSASEPDRLVARRAFAGLLWGKQVYRYSVREWLEGDPAQPAPPPERRAAAGRNVAWQHLELADVLSMPDDWEYPWFAAWDLAFHAVSLAHIDPAFAKDQLLLLCREWAQHPDGQLPAYEWSFSDVNPPVQAWAAWQVYLIDGARDRVFLGTMLTKLLLTMGWWLNRKDSAGNDLFEGGFLGMDNISVFDRSTDVPAGWRLEQSDATSWVAAAFLSMQRIALELARTDPTWEDLATTFLERFLSIAEATEQFGTGGVHLWDEQDGFYYDVLVDDQGSSEPLRVRSLVGLVPLLAVAASPDWASELPGYTRRRGWLEEHRPDLLAKHLVVHEDAGTAGTLALVDPDRWARILARVLDEQEFWSPHGIRSLSAAYRSGSTVDVAGRPLGIEYDPGESATGLFGGNSNWRGPVWMPVNVLLVDAIRTYADGAGREIRVELPTGSGTSVDLHAVADELTERLLGLFRPAASGRRPSAPVDHPDGAAWDHPTFSEYFHGDTGTGLGASHQTGWTALVAHLVCTTRRKQ